MTGAERIFADIPTTAMSKAQWPFKAESVDLRKAAFAACALLAAFNSPALGASFDCAKAGTAVEKTICGDAELSSLDEHLGRYYVVALEQAGAGAACLKSDQRSWVKTIRNPCGADAQCLSAAYLQRLAALDGFQPGASALKNIALPLGPGPGGSPSARGRYGGGQGQDAAGNARAIGLGA